MDDKSIIKLLKIKKGDKVLDIGGSMKQHTQIAIDTLVDILSPEESPYGATPLQARRFVQIDVTREKLPFKDKEFDVCLCTHTLEDLPTPFPVILEMTRVAKRGLIITPEMGQDVAFTSFNVTDWSTGVRRVPGLAHHKWLFYINEGVLQILPKNYGVLYSSGFHFTKWKGVSECVYAWKGEIKYREVQDLSIHSLIGEYQKYIVNHKRYLKRGLVALYFDNPAIIVKEMGKLLFRRGNGFDIRNVLK